MIDELVKEIEDKSDEYAEISNVVNELTEEIRSESNRYVETDGVLSRLVEWVGIKSDEYLEISDILEDLGYAINKIEGIEVKHYNIFIEVFDVAKQHLQNVMEEDK